MGFLLNLASFFLCFSYQISYSFPIPFLTSIDVAADENPIYCYRWRPCGRSMQIFFFFFVLFRFFEFLLGILRAPGIDLSMGSKRNHGPKDLPRRSDGRAARRGSSAN